MKTKKELNEIKEEWESLNRKLAELTNEELSQVSGGLIPPFPPCASGEDGVFKGHFDGNSRVVDINIWQNPGPQEYDCSGLI